VKTYTLTLPDVKTLTDAELWRIILGPETDRAPEEIEKFYQDVTTEFHRRKIKLYPVMDCSYCKKGGE